MSSTVDRPALLPLKEEQGEITHSTIATASGCKLVCWDGIVVVVVVAVVAVVPAPTQTQAGNNISANVPCALRLCKCTAVVATLTVACSAVL